MTGRSQAIITSELNTGMNTLMVLRRLKINPKYSRAMVKNLSKKRCFK